MFSGFSTHTIIIVITITLLLLIIIIDGTLLYSNYVDYHEHNKLEPYIAFGEDLPTNDYRYALSFIAVAEQTIGHEVRVQTELCTGSLISKDVVLTAAHCVYDSSKAPGFNITYYMFIEMCAKFGIGLIRNNDQRAKDKYMTFKSTALHPHEKFVNFNAAEGARNFDIMLIILPSYFKDIHEFSQLYGCPEMFKQPNTKRGKHIHGFAIGCGVAERNKEQLKNKKTFNKTYASYSREPRRTIQFPVTFGKYECMRPHIKGGFGVHAIDWKYSLCNIPPNRHHVCTGDSGGPFYTMIDGKVKQIGICRACFSHRRCPIACGCYDLTTVHTFLYEHKEWIINVAKSQNRSVTFEDCSPKTKKSKGTRLSLIHVHLPKNAQCVLRPSTQHRFPFNLHWFIIYILNAIYHYIV